MILRVIPVYLSLVGDENGNTALNIAAQNGMKDIMSNIFTYLISLEILIIAGANLNTQNLVSKC